VYTEVDVPLGLHAVARTAGAPSVRPSLSRVEPVYGLNSRVLAAAKFGRYPDCGRPAPQHQQRRRTLRPERTSLPVRLPGEHLHPQLWRSSGDGPSGRAGSST
jgi:hypothetical protein